MNKSLLLAFGIVISTLLGGCATAAMDTDAPLGLSDTPETSSAEKSSNSSDLATNHSSSESDIGTTDLVQSPESLGNGRHLSESYGDSEYFFKVEADISVPDVPIQQGTLKVKTLDVSLIEQYLCNGEKLKEDLYEVPEEGISYTQYISEGNTANNDLDFDMVFVPTFPDIPGMAVFSNYRLDSELSGSGFMPVNPGDLSEE